MVFYNSPNQKIITNDVWQNNISETDIFVNTTFGKYQQIIGDYKRLVGQTSFSSIRYIKCLHISALY